MSTVWETATLYAAISDNTLNLDQLVNFVADPGAGAIATFSGVTRNNFQGRAVQHLVYEAYVPMALSQLQTLCEQLTSKWTVSKAAISHRIGLVSIGEPSVHIAVSSPHRREALEAVAWAIDELKATVPIWKLEVFTDGTMWKENAESRSRLLAESESAEQVVSLIDAIQHGPSI